MSQDRVVGTQQGPPVQRGTLGPGGTGTAGGRQQGWPRSSVVVVGHTRVLPGQRYTREVCPEAEVYCPPFQLSGVTLSCQQSALGDTSQLSKRQCVTMYRHETWNRREQTKKHSKVRLYPCANFISSGGKNANLQMFTLKIGML